MQATLALASVSARRASSVSGGCFSPTDDLRCTKLGVSPDRATDRPAASDSSAENDGIVARAFEFGGKHAPGIGAGDGTGQRRFGHHHVARAGGCAGAGERAGGHDQSDSPRDSGSHWGSTSLVQKIDPQSPAADIIFGHARIQRFHRTFSSRQINPKNFSHPSMHMILLWQHRPTGA